MGQESSVVTLRFLVFYGHRQYLSGFLHNGRNEQVAFHRR